MFFSGFILALLVGLRGLVGKDLSLFLEFWITNSCLFVVVVNFHLWIFFPLLFRESVGRRGGRKRAERERGEGRETERVPSLFNLIVQFYLLSIFKDFL